MEIAYQIPRQSLFWVLLSVLMALAPHVMRLPVWISFVALACIAWRILIFLGKLDYPGSLHSGQQKGVRQINCRV